MSHFSPTPIGGFKVVYEYAQGLAAKGHQIDIIYSSLVLHYPPLTPLTALKRERHLLFNRLLMAQWTTEVTALWFEFPLPLRAHIKQRMVPDLRARFVADADVVIGTAYHTAAWVHT